MAKVMISMPDDLLELVDKAAKARETTRSGFLQQAAERALDEPTPESIKQAVAEARAALADAGPWDSAEVIREMRDERFGS